jgi:hypothetical protein
VLGSGGDCCKPGGGANLSAGTFYEGAMVTGYPSDATENAVQANIVAAGLGGGGSTGSTGPMHAVGAGKCLDVNGQSTTPGTQLQIWDCNGGSNQTWTRTASGQLTVYSGSSTMCMTAGNSTAGTPIAIQPCGSGTGQQWQANSDGTVTGVQSGLCLDVSGASTANGAKVQLWTCNHGSNQQWTLG